MVYFPKQVKCIYCYKSSVCVCVVMCIYVFVPEQVFSGDEESQVVGQPFLHESQTQPSSGPA